MLNQLCVIWVSESSKYNVNIILSVETESLGTGGPLRLAKDYLCNDNPE